MIKGKLAALIFVLMALMVVLTIRAKADQVKVPPAAQQIMAQWEDKPCIGRLTADINEDGAPDFLIYFLDDPATGDFIDAMALVTLDFRLWGFVESQGDDLAIAWMDPAAPELWKKWLAELIRAGNPKDLTI